MPMPEGSGSLRGRVAAVGIGESDFHKYGTSTQSEFAMVVGAILAAATDGGIDVADIDGFASYADDRNSPVRLANALGVRELRLGAAQWGGGGGGSAGHVALAAAAIASGLAECVVVYRGCRQGEVGRFGRGIGYGPARPDDGSVTGYELGGSGTAPYGIFAAPHKFAFRATRMLEEHGVSTSAMRAVSMAAYQHAQANPRAVMKGRPLTAEKYDESRWVAEPYRLFDCCQESDAAAAMILVSAERARTLRQPPAYLLAAGQSGEYRAGALLENAETYATAGFRTLADRLYRDAALSAEDIDSFQIYDNFTAGVVMSLVEFGVCSYADVNEVLTVENLTAPQGRWPLNTSGGNFAEAYILGMGHHLEAVRQLRGTSANQVPGARACLVAGGPMTSLVSATIYGTEGTL
jgi:acetyl-CoA acetyltransferase